MLLNTYRIHKKGDKKMIKIFFNDEQIINYLKAKGYIVRNKKEVQENIEKARNKRTEIILRKIEKAKEELIAENKDVNAHSISKKAGINYRTALKYL